MNCAEERSAGREQVLVSQPFAVIHFAFGATPTWFAPRSSPTIVPIVCVPWSLLSHGAGEGADVRGVVPVVVVVVRSVGVPPAVLGVDSGVRVPDAGVDAADDDVLAAHAERRPDVWRANGVQPPLGREDSFVGRLDRVGKRVDAVGLDLRYLGQRCDRLEHVQSRRHLDRVDDPERAVADTAGVEEFAYAFLATVRDFGQAVVDELAARVAVGHRVSRLEVGLLAQVDPEGRLALRGDLVEDLGLDRRRPGALGGR